jgi:hypothetical protein
MGGSPCDPPVRWSPCTNGCAFSSRRFSLSRARPAPLSQGTRSGSRVRASGAGEIPEPQAPTDDEAEAYLFLGLEGLLERLHELRKRAPPESGTPLIGAVPRVEASVRKRYAAGGFGGPVRHVVAVAVVGLVPLRPAAMADLMMEPEVERQVLAADEFRRTAVEYRLPGALRERSRVALLRQGFGPFRHDLRFTVITERRELADGRVLLRYDPGAEPPPQNVTLYRGGCLIEPDPAGAKVVELLIIGTSIKVPPFLTQGLRDLVRSTLSNRATNLWVRAWR